MDISESKAFILKNERIGGIISALWETVFFMLFLYAFFYQTVFKPINGAMIVLSVLCTGCMCIDMLFRGGDYIANTAITYKNMGIILVFVLSSMFTSRFTSTRVAYSNLTGQKMLEYALVATSLYVYLILHPGRFSRIMIYIILPIVLLALRAITSGTETTSFGAIGLEELNVNVMSSMFLMALFCIIVLIPRNKAYNILLLAAILILAYAQIRSASRRGFLVMAFFILATIVWGIAPFNRKKSALEKIAFNFFTFLILAIAVILISEYVLNDTALGKRLLLKNTSGDVLRKKYQAVAWELFLAKPVLGAGLSGVTNKIGVYSHSMYYELLACTGILGTVILSYFFIRTGADLYKKSKADGYMYGADNFLIRETFVFLLCLIVSGAAVVMIYDMYFYIWVAIIKAIEKNADEVFLRRQ